MMEALLVRKWVQQLGRGQGIIDGSDDGGFVGETVEGIVVEILVGRRVGY